MVDDKAAETKGFFEAWSGIAAAAKILRSSDNGVIYSHGETIAFLAKTRYFKFLMPARI